MTSPAERPPRPKDGPGNVEGMSALENALWVAFYVTAWVVIETLVILAATRVI